MEYALTKQKTEDFNFICPQKIILAILLQCLEIPNFAESCQKGR